jgi:RsiW-degrading membrane proteinase PrsW (M82 family)
MNVDALYVLLVIFFVTMFLLAVFYLSRRKMSKLAYAFWGIFALLLPAFGPFFVIAYRPGEMAPRKRGRQKPGLKRLRNVKN